jgi:hypothetical protein
MNTSLNNTTSRPSSANVNPFARALAEARGSQSNQRTNTSEEGFERYNQLNNGSQNNQAELAEQQRQQEERQKRERLRQQLHKQVNPVEARDVFNAQEQRIKKEIDEIRHELKLLSQEVSAFNQDVEISIMSNVAAPGTEGKYYFTFFQQLKAFIQLLRKKIHSARTWATAMNGKKKKKHGKAGLEISGQQYEQTTSVYDRMHHERSTVYSGS